MLKRLLALGFLGTDRRPFLLGCLAGIGCTLLFASVAAVAASFLFKEQLVNRAEKRLKAPPITSGLKADYGWQLTDLNGTPHPFSEWRGQTLFLHFWHPSCLTCLAEIPALNRLHEATQNAGIALVSVTWADAEKTRRCVEHEEAAFPVYLLDGPRPAVFRTISTPASYIIDANGNIVFKHIGGARWDDPSTIEFLRLIASRPAETPTH